ncbi:hypothetical protein QBC34DRAFT_299134 [Podospora aff. communis PSN243]|uniref:Nucleotidyltransferase n=1 Tax=Podospora aff. communis PSN243 TaxID=3040156 RepID=A0AAV9GN39_9PEZI|nr:hypothetical protein QBC34DRAFT_299134 [Podospora aff. communis PSN243]
MGGSAFGTGPDAPYTPRMSNEVYQHSRSSVHAILREIFVYVATPIEGPAKKDHGDLDVLVCLERRVLFPTMQGDGGAPRTNQELMIVIKERLGVEKAIVNGPTANLLIRWPAGLDDEATGQEEERNKEKHIQVDVRICRDFDQLSWGLFKHAHGDLWNLIGSTIRPFGFTVDEEALWVRIPEIEKFNKKRAKVLLTRNPVETVHFLASTLSHLQGMQVEGFWEQPFPTVEALFQYATTCRMFWVKAADAEDVDEGDAGVMGGEEGRKKLKHNDRRRMNGRAVYRQWITEYIPRLRAEGKFLSTGQDLSEVREKLKDEAIAWFSVGAEYNERLREWRVQRSVEEVKGLVKALIPVDLDNQYRAAVMVATKKLLLEDDQSFGIGIPPALKGADGIYDVEAVRDFIAAHWKQLGDLAWEVQQAKNSENMRLKVQKRKAEEA